MERYIIHLDMDAFFASVEMRDNPKLKGKPVVIGALPTERGVVSTCSYEARKFGIHSAMSVKEAYQRCPHAVFMHGSMRKYIAESEKIHHIMLEYTDTIEFVALDEGYMDVTGSIKLFGSAEKIALELKKRVYDEVGLTCSVGVGYSMMSAKLASEEKKPNGFFVIKNAEELTNLIIDRPVGIIYGVGKKTVEKLSILGIKTVRDMLDMPEQLIKSFGVMGTEMRHYALGIDNRTVQNNTEAKSIGREYTFQQNLTNRTELSDTLFLIARLVSDNLKEKNVWCRTITLKVKYADMKSITRSKSGKVTRRTDVIYKCVKEMFDNEEIIKPIRLLGISTSNLQNSPDDENVQLCFDDLIADKVEIKKENLDEAVFKIGKSYGRNIIKTAKQMAAEKRFYKE